MVTYLLLICYNIIDMKCKSAEVMENMTLTLTLNQILIITDLFSMPDAKAEYTITLSFPRFGISTFYDCCQA